MNSWVGFDLDGTLAEYNGWVDETHIGNPIKPIVDKAKEFISKGIEVRIFTARVSSTREGIAPEENTKIIQDWAEKHLGKRVLVTATKDFGMICLYDDRAKQVVPNTGETIEQKYLEAIGLILSQNTEIKELKKQLQQQDESRIKLANSC